MIFASSGNMLREIPKRFITVSSKQYVIGESVMTSIFSHGSPFKILRAISPAISPISSWETISPPSSPFPIPIDIPENMGICARLLSIWTDSADA